MEKQNKNNSIIYPYVMFAMGFCIFIGVCVGSQICSSEIIIEEKQQPMLIVEVIEWGGNIVDSSEVLFNYWISNYGNVEAKNVVVNCMIQDKDENIINEQSFKIGNVASNSYEWQQSKMKYYVKDYDNVYGNCKLESVDGDYINLLERLKELE